MSNHKKTQNDVAISVEGLSKSFKLPHERKDSLKEKILHFNKKTTFDKFQALKNINFEVKKGEFFGIVGRNGSGKSTLLKIIGGIYQPTEGKLQVNGTLTPFIELGIGFNPELTGRENVYLNGAILGLTRKEMIAKYDEIVAFAELEKFMDQKLKNYSSGMQVRLAFSIAIQAHNDILLIDEVLAVGDANFQRKCFKVFREVKNSGKTVVFVTHDMGTIQEYCDRAMMISNSEIVAIGSPRDIALNYEMANTENGSENLKKGLLRPDSPSVKILEIIVRSKTKPTTEFSLNEEMYFDVKFKVTKQCKLQFNLYFIRLDGVYVAGINSTKDLPDFSPGKGEHIVTILINAHQLPKQDYHVNVAVYSNEDVPELIDIMDIGYGVSTPRIAILEKSNYQDGEFYIQGGWKEHKS